MAINFPNDPATNPGDGNTWVDPDGNTWLVEIVSGEAIWTMTEAADTGGGGGGAVDSVNGETGVVSLGIQEMDDFELNIEPAGDFSKVLSYPNGEAYESTHNGPAGYWQDLLTDELCLFQEDANGVNALDYADEQGWAIGVTVNVSIGDGAPQPYVIKRFEGKGAPGGEGRNRVLIGFTGFITPAYDQEVAFWVTLDQDEDIPLAEGDILQWNDADQKFKPTQLGDAGTPLDGLLSVDGDAVKYGTAPTLGVDGTDLVIPTMGQVRGAIASNGGTSVSLNDLSDVSYSSGSLQITELDEVLFSSSDVPDNATWKFYVNSTYGLNFGAYITNNVQGAFIKAHHQKGISLQGDNDLPVWLTGIISGTDNRPEIRFSNGDPWDSSPTGNYLGFKMPAGVTSDVTWNLPATDGLANYVLSTDGAGNLTFTAPPSPAEAIRQYEIDYVGTTAYKFTGPGLDGTEENPAIYVSRGDGIVFSNLLGAHPFQLQTVAGTGETAYTDGVTGAQPISVGSFAWVVPMDAPSTLFYQCTAHTGMAGTIKVLDGSGGGDAQAGTTYTQSGGQRLNSTTGTGDGQVQTQLLVGDPSAYRLIFGQNDKDIDGSTLKYLIEEATLPFTVQTYIDGVQAADATITNVDTESSAKPWLTADWDPDAINSATNFFIEATSAPPPSSVDSVNSQTGVVSLGIQDMDDYSLRLPEVDGSVLVLRTGVDYTPGYIFAYSTDEVYISIVDKDGAPLLDLPTLANPANGTCVYSIDGTIYQFNYVYVINAQNGYYRFGYDSGDANSDVSGLKDIANVDADVVIKFGTAPALIPLAEGDILQWDNVIQKFKPSQLVDNDTRRIQDMDDYQSSFYSAIKTWTYSGAGNVQPASGEIDFSTGLNFWFMSVETDQGEDLEAVLYSFNGDKPVKVYVDGVEVYDGIANQWSNKNTNRIGFALGDDSWQASLTGGEEIGLEMTEFVLSGRTLTEGDVLQWNDADQKFQPTQPSSSPSALDDLTDVDVDSPTEGDTLTWDGTSWKPTAPPTGPSRQTVTITTAALNQGETQAGEIAGTGVTGLLLSVQTDAAAWIRIYTDASSSTADAGRSKDDDPVPGSGVLFEALYTTFTEKPITPGTTYFNLVGNDKLYWRITNESALAGTPINVTLKLLPLE